ncbi:MAG: type II toxin-antitoxin system RelE/ParE family toxin, partial [Gemmatimonadota bacterium]
FYEAKAAGLGAEFLTTLENVIEGAMVTPDAGSPYESGTRRVVLGRFPFSLVYEFSEGRLLVVAVAHHRRKPGYWRRE